MITIITTFANRHYEEHAKYFLDGLKKYLDDDINVIIYTDTPYSFDSWQNYILEDECPDLTQFKNRNGHRPIVEGKKGFIRDAVRFSHKSYCIVDAARKIKQGRMVWLDADSEIISPLTSEYLTEKQDNDAFVSYLGRPNRYSETGFLSFNLDHKHSQAYFDRWQAYYDTDLIYHLGGQLDCHVFDAVTTEFVNSNKIKGQSISPKDALKSHFDLAFQGVMCHYKGSKKENVPALQERRNRKLKT